MNEHLNKKAQSLEGLGKWIAILGAGMLLSVFLAYLVSGFVDPGARVDPAVLGQFGDVVGGLIGSLWALAGVLLFYAGMIQQKEATALMYRQLTEQEKTSQYAEQQRFESKFYNLLNGFLKLKNQLETLVTTDANGREELLKVKSIDFFETLNQQVANALHGTNVNLQTDDGLAEYVEVVGQQIFRRNAHNLDSYLKYVELLLVELDRYVKLESGEDSELYQSLIKVHLSDVEQAILLYTFPLADYPDLPILINRRPILEFQKTQHVAAYHDLMEYWKKILEEQLQQDAALDE